MEDLEEDATMRERVNIYKAGPSRQKQKPRGKGKKQPVAFSSAASTVGDEGEIELPEGPTLEEMLDDLDLGGGGEQQGSGGDAEMG